MTEILQNEYLQLLVWLFVVTWGLAFSVKNWANRIIAFFCGDKFYISDTGQILDMLWLVAAAFLFWISF